MLYLIGTKHNNFNMKKNPFLIDKKIIVVDNEINAIKGGRASGHTDCTTGGISACPGSPCPESMVVCPPDDTCVDGPNCDNSE